MISKNTRVIDRSVIDGESNLRNLKKYFDLVINLNEKWHLKFILATKLYHQALLVIEKQPDLAYLNLVSAIEVLANEMQIEKSIDDLNDMELKNQIDKIEDQELKQNIINALLNREQFIKKKFTSFIVNHIGDEFWQEEQPQAAKIGKGEIESVLSNIYIQRSRTLHDGEPFPPYIFEGALFGNVTDIPPFESMRVGEKKWDNKGYIPYFHFFERLVRHVLVNFIKMNQNEKV
jgi:hypothetical protein